MNLFRILGQYVQARVISINSSHVCIRLTLSWFKLVPELPCTLHAVQNLPLFRVFLQKIIFVPAPFIQEGIFLGPYEMHECYDLNS